MSHLGQLELFCVGVACVIDTILWLVLREPINRAKVAIWLYVLVGATWFVHVGSFLRWLLVESDSWWALRLEQGLSVFVAVGLIALPSGMLHSAIRLNHTGAMVRPARDLRYALLYLPMLAIPYLVMLAQHDRERSFLATFQPIATAYLVWLTIANLGAIILFMQLRKRQIIAQAAPFLSRLCVGLAAVTLFSMGYTLFAFQTTWEVPVRIVTLLLPVIIESLFVWYVIRRRVVPLVIERSLVYGGLLAIVLLLHRLVVSPVTGAMNDRFSLDWVIIEWIVILGVVIIWKPVRDRVQSALLHLISRDLHQVREATRDVSLALSQQTDSSPAQLIQWFETNLQDKLDVESVRISWNSVHGSSLPTDDAIFAELEANERGWVESGDTFDPGLQTHFESTGTNVALRMVFRTINGTVFLGPRRRGDRLVEEQLSAIRLLVDQFAATLFSRQTELQRLQAERKLMQHDKLASLGLIAGSLAHEIRNPLSSMRTLVSLVREQTESNQEFDRDLSLVLNEIDRLSKTTQRLLEFAKPSDRSSPTACVDRVLGRLAHILGQLARQYSVELHLALDSGEEPVAADEESLSEIFFNLVRNAIEAVRHQPDARVGVESRQQLGHVAVYIRDNGPGISPDILEHLYQPFMTNKPEGNGLGLYIAAARVREVDGRLAYSRSSEDETTFEVLLPAMIPPKENAC